VSVRPPETAHTVDPLYRLARPFLFSLPAEQVHHLASSALSMALGSATIRATFRRLTLVDSPALRVRRWGLEFPNPVGLAAGFDKGGSLFNALAALGFGYVEIGTVTMHAQPGNPGPRLFRLPADRALLNRLGFNNPGADAVAERLASTRIEPVLGVNIGKSKMTPLENATADYLYSFDRLERFADYIAVNVSSPNTPGLRELQEAEPLRELLRALSARALETASGRRDSPVPLLLKLAPDLTDSQIDQAVDIAGEEGCGGIIATNTTVARDGLRSAPQLVERLGAGGLSGAPLRPRAVEVLRRIYRRTRGELTLIGVGGILDADDAWERILAGANLLQLYTGFVYGGPTIVRTINLGLLERMERDGFRVLEQAVGTASG
jgi:dihydroorotate dehydrogenase